MLAISLAAVSAFVWGTADFSGGKAARRGGALAVTVVSQILGLPLVLCFVLVLPGRLHAGDLGWGACAGAAGLAGIVLLYRGLASGAMAVVAPIAAVTSALVPMTVGLVQDTMPPTPALAGATCAVVAIGLVSIGPTGPGRRASGPILGLALGAGVMFGLFFALLARTHDDSGMWPLAAVRLTSISLGLLVVASRGRSLRLPRPILGWVVVAGVGDIAANALFLLSTREGLLAVVAPIAALYPVSTVLLALAIDKERVRPVQIAGLGLAATALVLTAV
jgi:drug/metabolite transporter (DMT)-like permease